MTRPPNLANIFFAFVVWLTLPIFAAVVVLSPTYRLLVANWPEPLVEWIDDVGVLRLEPLDRRLYSDATPRTRPRSAARVDLIDGKHRLGYVVGVLDATGEPREILPAGWWRPRVGPCELGLATATGADAVEWIPCEQVQRVAWPNRLNFLGSLGFSIARVRDAVVAPKPVLAWPAPELDEADAESASVVAEESDEPAPADGSDIGTEIP
ncbi:MAG: hypothetical protein ACPGJE_03240 [Wenzhouxiangellaceae bacterium]